MKIFKKFNKTLIGCIYKGMLWALPLILLPYMSNAFQGFCLGMWIVVPIAIFFMNESNKSAHNYVNDMEKIYKEIVVLHENRINELNLYIKDELEPFLKGKDQYEGDNKCL